MVSPRVADTVIGEESDDVMRIAISGVNRGIGEGIARTAIERGGLVVGIGRKRPSWADEGHPSLSFIECDMANPAQIAEACLSIAVPIDVLICNAATFATGAGTIESFHPQAMSEAFAVNTTAPLLLARGLKRQLENGTRRLIIMMSTGNASLEGNTTGSLLGYRLSKTALNQAVRNLAAEWGHLGFRVVALNPGWVKTDMGGPDAEITVAEASTRILNFIDHVSETTPLNGAFVNTDGSALPW